MQSSTKSHSLLEEMKNGTATLKDSLAVSHKAKHRLNTQPSNCHPIYLLK